jgi:predicted permease
VSLALGIGANTAIFSFVNAILIKRLPVPQPENLVTFTQIYRGKRSEIVWPLKIVDGLGKQDPALDGVFGQYTLPISLSNGVTAHWINGIVVTGQFLQTLKVNPAIGRLLNEDDVRNATANPECVVSYRLWQRQFGGDPHLLGRTISLNEHAYHVLGVAKSGFYGARLDQRFDVAVPVTRIGDFMPIFAGPSGVERLDAMSWLTPMARLKPGMTRVAAQQQTELVLRQLDPSTHTDLRLEDGSRGFDVVRSSFGQPLVVLMGVVCLVLLVACANLANLLVARGQERAKEFAVRLSLGASRPILIRQPLVESFLLAVCGGMAGIALSFLIENTLLAFLNVGRSPTSALHVVPDANVLLFSVLLTFATAILFGLGPALHATRPDLVAGLKEQAAGSTPAGILLRRSFVVSQIALSLIVIFGAGLLTRTLRNLTTIDLGFQPARVIAVKLDPAADNRSAADLSTMFDEILQRIRDLPGVDVASLALTIPEGGTAISTPVSVPGYTPKPVRGDDIVTFNFVSPHYFETLGQPIIRGRDFNEHDNGKSALVAIVNERFVQHYFEGRNPVGHRFRTGGEDVEIVGVAKDARDQGIRNGPAETAYMPVSQGPASSLTILVRADKDTQRIVPLLVQVVESLDQHMPILSVRTLDLDIDAGISSERILGYLSSLLAGLTTLLAGIGLYGLVAYSVTRRTREIGVRIALGAQRREVAGLFARESLALLMIGLVIGGPFALISARVLRSVLFGVAANDPLTFSTSLLVLAIAALLATSIPLWRASRVNPMVALRWE